MSVDKDVFVNGCLSQFGPASTKGMFAVEVCLIVEKGRYSQLHRRSESTAEKAVHASCIPVKMSDEILANFSKLLGMANRIDYLLAPKPALPVEEDPVFWTAEEGRQQDPNALVSTRGWSSVGARASSVAFGKFCNCGVGVLEVHLDVKPFRDEPESLPLSQQRRRGPDIRSPICAHNLDKGVRVHSENHEGRDYCTVVQERRTLCKVTPNSNTGEFRVQADRSATSSSSDSDRTWFPDTSSSPSSCEYMTGCDTAVSSKSCSSEGDFVRGRWVLRSHLEKERMTGEATPQRKEVRSATAPKSSSSKAKQVETVPGKAMRTEKETFEVWRKPKQRSKPGTRANPSETVPSSKPATRANPSETVPSSKSGTRANPSETVPSVIKNAPQVAERRSKTRKSRKTTGPAKGMKSTPPVIDAQQIPGEAEERGTDELHDINSIRNRGTKSGLPEIVENLPEGRTEGPGNADELVHAAEEEGAMARGQQKGREQTPSPGGEDFTTIHNSPVRRRETSPRRKRRYHSDSDSEMSQKEKKSRRHGRSKRRWRSSSEDSWKSPSPEYQRGRRRNRKAHRNRGRTQGGRLSSDEEWQKIGGVDGGRGHVKASHTTVPRSERAECSKYAYRGGASSGEGGRGGRSDSSSEGESDFSDSDEGHYKRQQGGKRTPEAKVEPKLDETAKRRDRRRRQVHREAERTQRERQGLRSHYISVDYRGIPYGFGVGAWRQELNKLCSALDPSILNIRFQPEEALATLRRRLKDNFEYSAPVDRAYIRTLAGRNVTQRRSKLLGSMKAGDACPTGMDLEIWHRLDRILQDTGREELSQRMKYANAMRVNKGRTGPKGEDGIREDLLRELGRQPYPDEMEYEMRREKGYRGGQKSRKRSLSREPSLSSDKRVGDDQRVRAAVEDRAATRISDDHGKRKDTLGSEAVDMEYVRRMERQLLELQAKVLAANRAASGKDVDNVGPSSVMPSSRPHSNLTADIGSGSVCSKQEQMSMRRKAAQRIGRSHVQHK